MSDSQPAEWGSTVRAAQLWAARLYDPNHPLTLREHSAIQRGEAEKGRRELEKSVARSRWLSIVAEWLVREHWDHGDAVTFASGEAEAVGLDRSPEYATIEHRTFAYPDTDEARREAEEVGYDLLHVDTITVADSGQPLNTWDEFAPVREQLRRRLNAYPGWVEPKVGTSEWGEGAAMESIRQLLAHESASQEKHKRRIALAEERARAAERRVADPLAKVSPELTREEAELVVAIASHVRGTAPPYRWEDGGTDPPNVRTRTDLLSQLQGVGWSQKRVRGIGGGVKAWVSNSGALVEQSLYASSGRGNPGKEESERLLRDTVDVARALEEEAKEVLACEDAE